MELKLPEPVRRSLDLSVETHPDLESLAAFADGRLQGVEKEQVVAHLANCPACYDLFVECLHLIDEPEPGPNGSALC